MLLPAALTMLVSTQHPPSRPNPALLLDTGGSSKPSLLALGNHFPFGPPALLQPHHAKPWNDTQVVQYHRTTLSFAESTLEGGMCLFITSPDTSLSPPAPNQPCKKQGRIIPGWNCQPGRTPPPRGGVGLRAQKEPARQATGCKADA